MKEYFSHDYHARADENIIKLLRVEGWAGYGLYWALIEMLYEGNGSIVKDFDLLAYEMRTQCERIKAVCEGFELFYEKGGRIYSKSVQRRLEERAEKSVSAKKSATKRWADHANAMRTHTADHANAGVLKESKGKESKREERKEGEEAQTPPSILEVRALAEAEGLKADPDKFFHWQESKAWAGIIEWQAAFRYWCKTEYKDKSEAPKTQQGAAVGAWQLPESYKTVEAEQCFHGSAIKDGKCIYCKGAEVPVMGCNCEKYSMELAKYKTTAIGGR